jgi:hypothetical protein
VISTIFSIRAQRKANLISTGNLENSLRNSISDARRNTEERSLSYVKLRLALRKVTMLKPERERTIDMALKIAEDVYSSAAEDLLNAYDHACGAYLYKKVDKGRFERDYKREIINIVEVKEEDKILYDLIHSEPQKFNNIIAVYNKWKT